MKIAEISLYRVELPLTTPYRLSYRTFESFQPMLVRVHDSDGRSGWGEQHISPGSGAETRDGGWTFLNEMAARVAGMPPTLALEHVDAAIDRSPVAATALSTALEMCLGAEVLRPGEELSWPLLTAFNADGEAAIREEVESHVEVGYRTFKIKVGKDLAADIRRVRQIQSATAGRASLRIDANRAYSREQAIAFVEALDPEGVELFEQPCDAADWEANAAVAAVSPVPLMLDEPICSEADIDRAAGIPGVGLCKLKLKRFGSLRRLEAALKRVRGHAMGAVLGDGLGAEINCWMEACVASRTIETVGEFNGYLKIRPEARLLVEPLPFRDGRIVVPAGYRPVVDMARLAHLCLEQRRHAASSVAVPS